MENLKSIIEQYRLEVGKSILHRMKNVILQNSNYVPRVIGKKEAYRRGIPHVTGL